MRCLCWMRDKGFDSTQTRCTDGQCQSLHKPHRALNPVFQLEAEYTAKPVEQFTLANVRRIAVETCVKNRLHGVMILQMSGEREGALVLKSDTKRQRLHAAVEQVRRMRVKRST